MVDKKILKISVVPTVKFQQGAGGADRGLIKNLKSKIN